MKNISVLDKLQKIIETAEIISSVIPEEAMDDNWIQETIDNALGELERTTACLKDKYDLDIFDFDSDDDFLNSSELEDDGLLLDDDQFDDFDFGEEDDD